MDRQAEWPGVLTLTLWAESRAGRVGMGSRRHGAAKCWPEQGLREGGRRERDLGRKEKGWLLDMGPEAKAAFQKSLAV